MKKNVLFLYFLFLSFCVLVAQEQTPATEAGEDFDLNAVMAILENAEDLADFEKKINDKENQINNLDLNKDDKIDIIKIIEYDEGNTRLLVLQAVLGENDFQDIATIEIEKHSENEISLQVIGDPEIYGADYIVEPAPEDSTQGGQGGGNYFHVFPKLPNYLSAAVFVSVHRWRPMGPLFVVGRVVFISVVVWQPVPVWFVIRRPIARATWRGRTKRYRSNKYRSGRSRHSTRGRNMYSNKRKKSNNAKNNFGPKPTPSPAPNTNPSKQPDNKKSKPPSTSTGPQKNTSPNKSKTSGGPPKKKK